MLAAAIAAPKISFDTFAMIFFSAMFIDTQKNGLHRRKFHHSILSTMAAELDCMRSTAD